MRMDDSLKSVVSEAIDAASDTLHQLSKYIWENPELGLEEYKAHDYISKVLQDQGFTVTPHYLLQTAFRWVGGHYYTTLSSPDSLQVGRLSLLPHYHLQTVFRLVGCHYYTTLSPPDSLQTGRLSLLHHIISSRQSSCGKDVTMTPYYHLQTAFRRVGCHYYTTLSSPDSLHVGRMSLLHHIITSRQPSVG